MNRKILTAALAAGLPISFAAAGGGDVGLLLDGNRIVTAVADDETAEFSEIGERVFGADIDFVSNVGDDPGFFTTDGPTLPSGFSAFDAGTTITYQTNGAIQAWNGSGFEATSNQLRQIAIPGILEILSPTDGSTVDGFEYTYGGGDFDEHPDYAMADASTAGIFLWKIQFSAFDGSSLIAESQEAWIVFNFGLSEEEHEAAIAFAEANVPTPMTLAPLAGLGLAAARRRRA
jgi:hypothetical protein